MTKVIDKEVGDEALDEEGQKILADMEAEKGKVEDKEPEKIEEDAGEKSEEKPKVEEEPKKEEPEPKEEVKPEGQEEKPKRTPKLMEAWEHEVYKNKSEKQTTELQQQVNDLTAKLEGKTDSKKTDAIKAFAEKNGWDEDAVVGLLELVGVDSLKKELTEKLGSLEAQKAATFQETEFTKEYSEKIPTLLKSDNIIAGKETEVQKVLHDLAFTKRYADLGLDEIYVVAKSKGYLDDFIKGTGRKTAEGSRGGSSGTGGGDTEKKAPEDMTDEEFVKFSDSQGMDKGDKWSVPGQD